MLLAMLVVRSHVLSSVCSEGIEVMHIYICVCAHHTDFLLFVWGVGGGCWARAFWGKGVQRDSIGLSGFQVLFPHFTLGKVPGRRVVKRNVVSQL